MTDFHDNIFNYYRGPEQAKQGNYDAQLEDNTTKALVNTLQHCDPAVAIKFLEWLGVKTTAKVGIELQRQTIGEERIRRAPQRVLLGLVAERKPGGDEATAEADGRGNGESRPDAWLYGEDFVVAIESKVGDAPLERDQMQKHLWKLQVDAVHQPTCVQKTWADVRQFFAKLLPVSSPELNDKDKWLIQQFTQYLEWNGMTQFTGFQEWMFEFLVRVEKDGSDKKLIHRTMEHFGDSILRRGVRALDPSFYEACNVGNFSGEADHFWMSFGPAGGATVHKWKAHQTVSLYDRGLAVLVNVRPSAIGALRKRLGNAEQRFEEIVSGLPGKFFIEVSESKLVRPRKSVENPIATLEAGTYELPNPGTYGLKATNALGFDYLRKLVKQIRNAHFRLVKRIDRREVLNLSSGDGDALVDAVVSTMKSFHPLVEFINERAESP